MSFMQETRVLDELGRIVIPRGMREALELSEGSQLVICCESGAIAMKKADKENKVKN